MKTWNNKDVAKIEGNNIERNSRRLHIALNGVKHFVNNLQQYVSGRIESMDWKVLDQMMTISPTITDVSELA